MFKQLQDFLLILENERGLSANTLSAYRQDLKQYIDFLQEEAGCTSWQSVSEVDVMKYLYWLRDRGCAPATMARKTAALRGLHQYLMRSHERSGDPTYSVEVPKVTRSRPKVLSFEEVERLLMTPDTDTSAGKRDRAMLEVLYATGMRVTELICLNLGDLYLSMGFLRCSGSGGSERILPIGRHAEQAVRTYIEEVRPSLAGEGEEEALFLNLHGRRMTRQGFWKILKKYAELAKIDTKMSPETLRHSFAAHLLERGADLESVEELMGRAEPTLSKRYGRPQKERLKDVYTRYHPRA